MMDKHIPRTAPSLVALLAAAALAACGPQGDSNEAANADGSAATPRAASNTNKSGKGDTAAAKPVATPAPRPRGEPGTITAVVPIETPGEANGTGAVIGGVVGAAVGNQVGGGSGRGVATVVGAVGGAAAGHQIEKHTKSRVTGWRVDVKLDSGAQTSVTLAQPGALAAGQRVRVVDGGIQPA